MKTNLASLAAVALTATLLVFSSCKKDSGGGAASNGTYYLTASINGTDWSATFPIDSAKDVVTAVLSGTGSTSIGVVLGAHVSGTDTSAIELAFPMSFSLNVPFAANPAFNSLAAYSPDITLSLIYLTPNGGKVGDSITITTFDQTNNVIAGTFKGTFVASSGSGSMTVTNGQFKTKYVVDANSGSNGGMTIKF